MQDDDAVDALFDAVRSDVAAQPPAGVWESALEAAFTAEPVSADEAGVPEMDDDPVFPDDEVVLDDGSEYIDLGDDADDDQDDVVLGDTDEIALDGDTDEIALGAEEFPADDHGGPDHLDPPTDDHGDGGW
ncbi:hypothetical protein [Rhodococcus gannanensis]|uniref:Uncharacterized protein n=1 Tax=Rhodococcus gannanensis TaxID=1960308 RepID=A0ABW4P205_9NOCA